jgi:hypothetical protein
MSRHTATATHTVSLWASIESAARAAARHFAVRAETGNVLATLEHEQNLIRQSSRHWLVG